MVMRFFFTSFFPIILKMSIVKTSPNLKLLSTNNNTGHFATDINSRVTQNGTRHFLQNWLCKQHLWSGGQCGPPATPRWKQQWRASKSSPRKASDDLLHISQIDCRLLRGKYQTPCFALGMAMSAGAAPSHLTSHARSMPALVGSGSPRSRFGDLGFQRWRTPPM